DPADWGIRVYMPRAFSELQGLSLLPPLGLTVFGHYALPNLPMLLVPPVAAALKALGEAAEKAGVTLANIMRSNERLAALGFPPMIYFGGIAEAPFDLMSDTMRGMRGIFLDMLRCPDKLLAAEEKVAAFQVEYLLSFCQATGAKYVFFPLHRGSDGFMSIKQFEKFYWPQLTGMFDKLIEREITPFVFYEGVWNQRLKHVAALPKGKTIGWFQASDIFKVKETCGDTLCIVGGMPNSMLQTGTVETVREHTKKLCQVVGKGGGFVMSTGVGEMEGSKPELVKAWVEATHEFGVY
ncbi:MAG TPA: uroporphyrinogen decarboxylase family protein, partial [Anaerolineae bacterium]